MTIPSPVVSDEEIDAQIERLRQHFAELATVDRPAQDGDNVTIDIAGWQDGEPVDGLTADDYLYEVGAGAVVPEIDDQLRGAKVGDILEFDAEHPDPDSEAPAAPPDPGQGGQGEGPARARRRVGQRGLRVRDRRGAA